jgi:hypothetical protein
MFHNVFYGRTGFSINRHKDKENTMSTMAAEKATTNTITVKDGTTIYYKDWARDSLLFFPTAGHSTPTRGTRK